MTDEAPNPRTTPIRVVLVDDHEMFRAGVASSLGPECEVVGQASDVPEAIAAVRGTLPDVVLLDVHLPGGAGGGGAEVVRVTADLLSHVRFLALSVSDAPADVVSVIRAGARGYVTKTISSGQLTEAIIRVADGDAVFSPRLAGFVLDAFGSASSTAPVTGQGSSGSETDPELDRLTPREREVMRLIARGLTYREVASDLFLSVKTVETHVSAVLRKLQLSNRNELTKWASTRGIV